MSDVFKYGERVTTSITGDTVWTVKGSELSPLTLRAEQPGGGVATLVVRNVEVSRVRMSEPTELGAVVMTDKGRAVRIFETPPAARDVWFLSDLDSAIYRRAKWSELKNPRPVGDQ
jgi:hypothetical protein